MAINTVWVLESNQSAQDTFKECLGLHFNMRLFTSLGEYRNELLSSIKNTENLPDLLIVELKVIDGFFLDLLRDGSARNDIPFIVVSEVNDIDIIRECYRLGAQDYLTKPFDKNELRIKTERLLSQLDSKSKELQIDSFRQQICTPLGPKVQLTTREMQIFYFLYKNMGNTVPKEKLVKEVWKDIAVSAKALDVHLFNLRKKISGIGLRIQFLSPNSFSLSAQPFLSQARASIPDGFSQDHSSSP